MTEAYPLYWPHGWPRTPSRQQERSRFARTPGRAQSGLLAELRQLGAKRIILSSNIPLRKDGLPYASRNEPEDAGVAAWFTLDGEEQCIPCDRWWRVWENTHAIALSVGALRGLDRWGAKSMMRAAFRGFAALPAPNDWRGVLGQDVPDRAAVERRFRELARERHPDRGGSHAMMTELNAARDAALRELA